MYLSYAYTFSILLMMMKSIVWKLLYFLDEKFEGRFTFAH